MRTVLCAAAAVLIAGCGTSDTAAEGACTHFHNVVVDAVDGVLTDAELRAKIAEVADTAAGSDVAAEARTMLAALTSGGDFNGAVAQMSAACDPHRG